MYIESRMSADQYRMDRTVGSIAGYVKLNSKTASS
eukprot:CAMPEP_0194778798 /NCGR_PEP_ID=MMETSP0323_2-20130528/69168_1 /TAXON_ID=2866 ORGANISM="Crypthecodinium cohnii, Strain Seligo" /NCGR_SAMPLE_ID=MMETSP0323_2 /ASSEMBLY_ACC=CAM_ASM_000346 /LENGTH=34 /DNA_ID= /DNA_START= /DNA_END= /DNA_ORIENTATION=